MPMMHSPRTRRLALPSSLALLLLSVWLARPSAADDKDLLRFDTAKPYVFIILDSSTSMNLDLEDRWVHANGDDPRSKIYQAKEVLYDALSTVDGAHFGFVTYNQDQLRVVGKHWLYMVADTGENRMTLESLPIPYPLLEPGNAIDEPVLDGDGNPTGEVEVRIDGDLLTLGSRFLDSDGLPVSGGTCENPLDLDSEREKINRFAKLGLDGGVETPVWVQGGTGNRTWRIRFRKTVGSEPVGSSRIRVQIVYERLGNSRDACNGPSFSGSPATVSLELALYRPFLQWGDSTDKVHLVPEQTQNKNLEVTGGHWDWRDVVGQYRCGRDKPFSGEGWEGNYDTGDPAPSDPELDQNSPGADARVDTYCPDPADPLSCSSLLRPTLRDSLFDARELDRGDMLPFHWSFDNKEEFLGRINPLHAVGGRAFGIAPFFDDELVDDSLPLLDPSYRPLIAAGNSPLSDLIVDFRCWYTGIDDNKCRNDNLIFEHGFQALAAENDPEWSCRRPYLLFITDGENNCSGENPTADVANLFSDAAIRSWVINLGSSNQGAINSIVRPGQGEVVTVETKEALKTELSRILGLIEEESRSFASAAVPSVQADVADKIYITQFTPLNGESVWDGHVHSFLKPLPLLPSSGAPDTTHENHLWDAGSVMVDGNQRPGFEAERQSPEAHELSLPLTRDELRLGPRRGQRRVYTAMAASGKVPRHRITLGPADDDEAPSGFAINDLREDLWHGLGLVGPDFDLGEEEDIATLITRVPEALLAHQVFRDTFKIKESSIRNPDGSESSVRFVLGDIFHSNPLVIGSPTNTRFFAKDLFGYRSFSERQQRRRKVLLVSSNDGMVHGFDAGVFRDGVLDGEFDDGKGRELFAVAPRLLLPTITKLARGSDHLWGADGSLSVADVYVDPEIDSVPVAEEREWRTLAVAGLRRGGQGYFALDLTEPDPMVEDIDPETDLLLGYIPDPDPSSNGDLPANQATYPAIRWELTDTSDEDGNLAPDLGQTWSTPNLGAIRVIEGGQVTTKFVAIFGGGLDPSFRPTGGSGNWLYMADLETGEILYKRKLEGAAPAEPASVDTDQDGYLDRIYIGTLAGFLYRVDIDEPVPLSPWFGGTRRILDARWSPYKIFDTIGPSADGTLVRRPIYFPPSVLFVARLGTYALAFGTGNREDLWAPDGEAGNRVYVFVDDSPFLDPADLPTDETFLVALDGTSTEEDILQGRELLGGRGWVLHLDAEAGERVVTKASSISGITVFSTFLPEIDDSEEDPDIKSLKVCEKSGNSRNYVVFTNNGNGVFKDPLGEDIRYDTVTNSFVTEPYIEQGQTRNQTSAGGGLEPDQKSVMEALKELFPEDCRFVDSYRFDIKTVRSDTGVVSIAPLPVCIRETNWKEY